MVRLAAELFQCLFQVAFILIRSRSLLSRLNIPINFQFSIRSKFALQFVTCGDIARHTYISNNAQIANKIICNS